MTPGVPESCSEGAGNGIGINVLPNELLLLILTRLDWECVVSAAQVCRRWRQLALAPFLWENLRLVICMKNHTELSHPILARVAVHIRRVKLQYFKLYSRVRESPLLLCANLTHLDIVISQVDSVIFEDLRRWPRLRHLSFRNSLVTRSGDGSDGAAEFHLPFASLPELRAVALSNFGLTAGSLRELVACRHLVSVDMEKMKNVDRQVVLSLARERRDTLEAVRVYGDTLDEACVAALAACRRLSALHIMTCKTLLDSCLGLIAGLTQLTALKLRHGYFSSRALLSLFAERRFPRLAYLSLSRCSHVDMRVAKAIKLSAPALTELSFYLCPFLSSTDFDRSELEKLFPIQLLLD